MAAFDTFKLWYAASIANNSFALADADKRIENTTTPTGEEIQLIYCIPTQFQKRVTDVSNALAVDPKAPDTGTAGSYVTLRFAQKRNVAPTVSALTKLRDMFYLFGTDDTFISGRFGLENTDNPELDCLPIANAGYRMVSFKQEPNQNQAALLTYEVVLRFLGDHTKLGTRSP